MLYGAVSVDFLLANSERPGDCGQKESLHLSAYKLTDIKYCGISFSAAHATATN